MQLLNNWRRVKISGLIGSVDVALCNKRLDVGMGSNGLCLFPLTKLQVQAVTDAFLWVQPPLALSFYSFFTLLERLQPHFFLTQSNSTYFTIFHTHSVSSCYCFPPPPLPVVEVVSVMAVGRLPAAGEILINSLFICVERRAPAFWALVLWWR